MHVIQIECVHVAEVKMQLRLRKSHIRLKSWYQIPNLERAYCTYRCGTCDGVSDLGKDGDRLDGARLLSNSPLVQ